MTGAASNPLLPLLDEDWDRALCVVAHPDDLEYGASLAVARWTAQGKQVVYVLATRGEAGIDGMAPEDTAAVREREQRAAAAAVGVDTVEFLDHPDGLIEYGLPLRRHISRMIRRHRPELLVGLNFRLTLASGGVNQADHRHVGLALLDAAADAGNRWIWEELLLEGFEPWAGVRRIAFAGSPRPTHGVDVAGFLDEGIASLRAHETYLAGLGGGFDPATFLAEQVRDGGRRCGVPHAVTFEVFDR
jgi:LmbE family N-acetylglucosaminyl deacetylase